MHLTRILLLATALAGAPAHAQGVYQKSRAFLDGAFDGPVPKPEAVWMTPEVRGPVKRILGHEPTALRVRYWSRDQRSVWILDEIGKEKPITVGIVVNAGRIEKLRVLVFRESRGYEVRHPFFTGQFRRAGLRRDLRLDRPIDGISGATLSVRALKKLARLALYLHQHTHPRNAPR